jgi:hypothetical protein
MNLGQAMYVGDDGQVHVHEYAACAFHATITMLALVPVQAAQHFAQPPEPKGARRHFRGGSITERVWQALDGARPHGLGVAVLVERLGAEQKQVMQAANDLVRAGMARTNGLRPVAYMALDPKEPE